MIRSGLALSAFLLAGAALAQQPVAAQGEPIEAPGPLGPLAGTMIDAGRGAPVVLIVPGSGPTDRDGNNPAGVKAQYLKLLAEGLAAQGVSSVRTDKRGMFASKEAVVPGGDVRIAEYVTDIGNWMQAIRARTGARCVWVLGHSEGGMVALAAADTGTQRDLCGLVLVASLGRPMVSVMREQFTKNPANAPLLPQILPVLDSIEAGKVADTSKLNPFVAPIFSPVNQRYLIDANRYDPAKLAARYRGRMLIVQGGRDLQTTMDDARAIQVGQPGAELKLLPEMNHVLKAVASDDWAANVATYADPALPLAPGLVDAVAGFVRRHRAK